MGWKMFGIKGKSVSGKQKMLKVVRLIGDLGKEGSNVSPLTTRTHPKAFNLHAYTIAKQGMHEIEAQRAMSLAHWYMWDRPK